MTGIAMQGMSDIMALYSEGASSLCVNGSVDMLGRLAGISASKYTGYPPYDDAPKEGEFDWEGFTRNLAIGLGVVAVCAIGAAISIATLGAGSILAGGVYRCGYWCIIYDSDESRRGNFEWKCPKCERSFSGCRNISCQRFYNGGIWSKISGSTSFG